MINRKTPRPSRAVENLQQFCLNNSAGIDCTAPHSNVKNIYDSTNLVPNPDGSLSLRKPLLIKHDWTRLVKTKIGADYTVLNVIPLYTEDAYLLLVSDTLGNKYIAIWDVGTVSDNKFASSCTLMWTDKDDIRHTKEFFDGSLGKTYSTEELSSLVNLDNVKTFHSATSTVLCNCRVGLNSTMFDNDPMSDISLYPSHSGNTLLLMPRFIKVYRNYLHKWFFEIHNPEVNTFEINSNTGTYEHPINTALDDMYVLRDAYGAGVPVVKQIVPYVFTERFGDNIALKEYPKTIETVVVPHFIKETLSSFVNVNGLSWEQHRDFTFDCGRVALNFKFNVSCEIGASDVPTAGNKWYRKNIYTVETQLEYCANTPQEISLEIPYQTFRIGRTIADGTILSQIISLDKKETTKSCDAGDSIVLHSDNTYSETQYFSSEPSHISTSSVYGNILGSMSAAWNTILSIENAPDVTFTETVSDIKFRGVTMFPKDIPNAASVYLKAFCSFPKPNSNLKYYATWLYTLDGISWLNAIQPMPDTGEAVNAYRNTVSITVDELPIENVDTGIDSNKVPNKSSTATVYAPLYDLDNDDTLIHNRVDLLKISETLFNNLINTSFRFKIVAVQGDGTEKNPYKIVGTYGQADYVPMASQKGEYWYSNFGNSVLGEKLYYKSRIFSFGDPSFKNNIFVSEPGEFILPFKNTIDISASEDSVVTSITPWKNYLFVSTPQALYLISQVDSGWLTKTANAALGISQTDAMCVVATLNSIIFKSGSKIYMFYPNIYAGDDSVINVTDMSSPIEHLLEGFDSVSGAFAFGTNSEYVLILPKPQGTLCLSYDYTTRVWTKTEYPVRFTKHIVNSLTDIVLFGQNSEGDFCEYHYNKTFAEAYGKDVGAPYGDVLVESENGILNDIETYGSDNSTLVVTPIHFGLDTGQKAEAIVTTKQFVETKFVLATLDKADAFPMQLTVHIDGDPHIVTRDISTDAAFWKDSSAKGILNTTFSGLSDNSDTFNVLRQLVVRYSGKGKSIRHILEGQSLSNFKLYETYIRYKLLNVKQ